jgi:hypothetical protein
VNNLVKEITKGLLEEEKRTVAVYGGGFKPPTAGHFEVVETALKKNPNIDKFIILIGGKGRDGVTSEESLIIWDIYKQYLPINVEVKLSPKPPIQAVYNYAKEHPDEDVIFVIGAREGNEDDFKDIANRTTSVDKYPNLRVSTIVTQGGASGTAARNAAKISAEKLRPLLPKQLKDEEVEEIFSYINDTVMERKILKEVLDSTKFDFKPLIKSLTSSMEADGLNLKPYPKIIFKHDEEANAEDFFGKTAYYDPNNNEVVLYTLGRHPKDIMRSYAHELIHVHQNHEDRLEGINTDNVNEDDYLEKIEREAYEKGNIAFRSWTNSLNEDIKKINYTKPNFKDEWEEAIRYSEFKEMGLKSWIEIANKGYITNYSKIKDKLGNVDLKFDSLEEPKKQRFQDALNKGNIEMSIAVKFSDDDYDLVAGNTRISGLVKNKIDPKIWVVDLSNNLNEEIVGEKIKCDNCGWDWNIVDGGDDLFICHECGHDNELINENLDDSNLNNQLKNYIEDYSDIDVSLLKNLSKIKNKYPKQLDPKVGGNEFGYRGTTFDKDFIKKLKVKSKSNGVTEYEVPSDLKITSRGKKGFLSFSTDEEVAKGFGHYSGYVDHKKSDNRIGGYVKVSLDNPNFIIHPDYMGELSKDMEYSKESEKETLYVGDSFTPKSIFVVDKDLYKLKEDKKKDPFGLNAFAHELAQLNEEEGEYYIYLDMDGVVADFDKRFNDLSGMLPQAYVDKNGLNAFWDLIDEKHKVAFWRGIELMPGAEKLVRYIEQHPFEMLTAPSIKKQSVIGKSLWVKDKVGTLYSTKPKVTYRSAKQKHTVKPNLTKFDILIDDKGSSIDNWNAAGGTGIFYKNADQVINDLKKLGL